ncbi:MAG: BON domain-containing protein, partial [Pseudomonadota bacterium]
MRPPAGARPVGRFVNRPAPASAPIHYTDPSTGGSWGPLLLGLLLLAVVGWLAVKHYTPTIQDDLLERSRASLDSTGVGGNADVSIDGRNITITGNVSSEDDRMRAEDAVASTFGVRSVTNELTVGQTDDSAAQTSRDAPSFAITTGADGVTLRGIVSDQKFADSLSAAASEQYDNAQITNEITVDEGATNPGWTAAVAQLLPELKSVDNGTLEITGDTATISGKTDDAQLATSIGEKANALLGAQLSVVNNIEAPEVTAPSLPAFASVSETDSQVTLNGFMSAEGAAAIAGAYDSTGKTVVNNISTNDLAETPAWVDNFNGALAALEGVSDGKLTIARSGNVKLQGSVETDEQKQTIGASVTELFGAETPVSNDLLVVPPPVVPTMTPFASISQSQENVTISGLLPPGAAELLVDSIGKDRQVINRITVDERVMQPEWAEALGQSVGRLGSIENGSINVASNGTLTIKGDAKTDQAKQFAGINLGTLFGSSLTLQNEINVTPPPMVPSMSPFMSIRQSAQSVVVSGLLPETAANNIVDALSGDDKEVTNNITVDERVMQPAWGEAAGQSLNRLGSIENGAINIASDGTLSLRGEADTEQAKQFAGINLGALFGDSVSLRNDISVKTPTIVETPKPDIQALLSALDLSGIRFRSGSAELDAGSEDILDEVADVLSLVDDARILIAGHTDSRGNTELNF